MPESTTELIKSRLDITEVIREYIEIKAAGSYMKARCPFHNEKTPSFMVSPQRQMYHCFGCGEHGDIFTFVQKMEGVEFPEALRMLAKKAGVELQHEDPRARNERTKLFDIIKYAARVYHEQYKRLPDAHPVKEYVRKRHIPEHIVEEFIIGYAPDAWDSLYQLLLKKNISPQDAQAAGLLVRRDDNSGFYDRFRARLMFPIADVHGNIVGFGGRVIPTLDAKCLGKDAAKYVNSPQTGIYNKSAILYGLHLAKTAIRTEKKVVVVEGYMDCIAAHKTGTEHVVAASGTAFTAEQARLLKRFTTDVLLAFDVDAAGVTAASRGVGVLLAEGMTVRVVPITSGKDPDDMIRENPDAWRDAVTRPVLFMDFAIARAVAGQDLKDIESKKRVAQHLIPLVATITDGIEQTHYTQQIATLLRVDESVIRDRIRTFKKEEPAVRERTSDKKRTIRVDAGQELFSIVLRAPELYPYVYERLPEAALSQGPFQALYKISRDQYNQSHEFDPAKLRESLRSGDDASLVEYLDIAELGAMRLPDNLRSLCERLIDSCMQEYLKKQLVTLSDAIRQAESVSNREELDKLSRQFQIVAAQLKEFSSRL